MRAHPLADIPHFRKPAGKIGEEGGLQVEVGEAREQHAEDCRDEDHHQRGGDHHRQPVDELQEDGSGHAEAHRDADRQLPEAAKRDRRPDVEAGKGESRGDRAAGLGSMRGEREAT